MSSILSTGRLADSLKYSQHRDDPADFLGLDNDQFNAFMEQLAYTSPADYLKIKHKLFKLMIMGVIKNMHELIYNALTVGTINGENMFDAKFVSSLSKGGQEIVKQMRETFGDDGFKPSLPKQEANNITLSLAKAMRNNISTHVVDKIMDVGKVNAVLGNARKQADMKLGADDL